MNRSDWLKLKRRLSEERYDRLWAPIYDENWGSHIDRMHREMLTSVVESLPAEALILDAACGTGKYWGLLKSLGREFVGIDQSGGMLERAREKFPAVPTQKVSLQEMRFKSAFDMVMCMDAMEMIFPEDWNKVLRNFYRALKPGGQLYFTVEMAEGGFIEEEYRAGRERGLPVVYGEAVGSTGPGDEEGGYHYYPSMEQVRRWLREAGFCIVEEEEEEEYHHFWARREEILMQGKEI